MVVFREVPGFIDFLSRFASRNIELGSVWEAQLFVSSSGVTSINVARSFVAKPGKSITGNSAPVS
jgi:hypothetical protein